MSAGDGTYHPYAGRSWCEGLTLLDWCDWMLSNAWNAGKLRAVRIVEKLP